MKTFRYHIALLIVILMAIATNVQAQDDERALGAAADTIIRTETRDYIVNRIVENVYQSHPTASLATRLAKAYYNYNENSETKERMFHKNDTAHAFLFIKRALELDPKYAPAYVLASDILNYAGQRDVAMQWLDNGIAQNPTDSSLYIASAMLLAYTDSEAAVAKLKLLKEKDPNFPVDLQLGRLYYELWNRGGVQPYQEMADAYSKANMADMTQGDLDAFSFSLYATNQTDRLYEVSNYGVSKYPESFMLNQNLFYGLLGLCQQGANRWGEAIAAANKFFSIADSAQITPLHYIRYGEALNGDKQYAQAIAVYEKILEMPNATENNIYTANNHIATSISSQADEARKAGDYDKAVAIIKPYVEKYNAQGKQNDLLVNSYARIYMVQSVDLEGAAKEDALMKADKIYADAIPNTKDNDDAFAYQRYVIHSQLDPTKEKGLAIPYINEVIRIIQSKKEMGRGQKARLVSVYLYLCVYNLGKNKKAVAEYADKIMDLDPTNEDAPKFAAWAAGK